jgi:uncharacterized protein (TIGR03118 family)
VQTNLVSDIAGVARFTDPNLVNPWGIAYGPGGPFWVSDNNAGVSTLYGGDGTPQSLVVHIPGPHGSLPGTSGTPTGIVFNGGTGFNVSENGMTGSSIFIFATEDGTIAGWSPGVDGTHAIIAVDNSTNPTAVDGAVYKGLAMAGNFIYATDFRHGTIDAFDQNFHKATFKGNFTDPNIPKGFAPFGIQNIGGKLFVTYAKQDTAKHDDVGGAGNGFVDVFSTNGVMLERLAIQGTLNSPWGLAMAPANFGSASNDLLVGNFKDGRINVFDPNTKAFLGQLNNQFGNPITIDRLWSLKFGNGGMAGAMNQLFFTAGIGGEMHGLFGNIRLPDADGDTAVRALGTAGHVVGSDNAGSTALQFTMASDNADLAGRQSQHVVDGSGSQTTTSAQVSHSGRSSGHTVGAEALAALDDAFASDWHFGKHLIFGR